MSKNNNTKSIKWYNSGNIITTLIITAIALIIICSQSFAVGSSFELFSSVINHNSVYLFILVYFIFLKFSFGKKYFNYMNIFLTFIYLITTATSLLTLIQNFSLNAILDFAINLVILIYIVHTLFRDTSIWKDHKIDKSPFNELSNDWLFGTITILSVTLLAVNLINTAALSGVVLSILDSIYFILFARYIYLYRDYLDKHKIDSNPSGNFDEVREKVQDVLDKTEIDDIIIDASKNVVDKVDNFIKENEIDKAVEDVKDTIVDVSKDAINTVSELVTGKKEDTPKEKKTTTKKKTTKKEDK